jgi:translation initiation factor IF-1
MPKSDMLVLEGTVTSLKGHGYYQVRLDNDHDVLAMLSGRMIRNKIRIIQEDRVVCELSPYSLDRARITYRYR